MITKKINRLLSVVLAAAVAMLWMVGMTPETFASTTTLSASDFTSGTYVISNASNGDVFILPESSTGISGTISVSTTAQITIQGSTGTSDSSTGYSGLSINCTVAGANLTIQDLYITSPYSGGNVINFTGEGNSLTVAGTNILESNGYNNQALIHVGAASETSYTSLTVNGNGNSQNLYLYKRSSSAAIGGNTNEASGAITFNGGNLFVKGSQTGAVIGGDSSTLTPRDITINGGTLNVLAAARGAGIGGSNQTNGGNLYINGGNTTVISDWNGPAIGHGNSGTSGGNVYITGGSLYVTKTNNSPLAVSDLINADVYGETSATAVQQVNFVPGDYGLEAGPYTVIVDGSPFYTGNVNNYYYRGGNDITYTPDNWIQPTVDQTGYNNALHLYIPVNASSYSVADAGSHAVSFVLPGTTSGNSFGITYACMNASVTAADGGNAVNSVSAGNSVNFRAVPDSGYSVQSVTASNGTITQETNGTYTLSNVTAATTVSVNASAAIGVTFTGGNARYLVGGQSVTSAQMAAGGSLNFVVSPIVGYEVSSVVPSSGTITCSASGVYTLTGAALDVTVTVSTAAQSTSWASAAASVSFAGTGTSDDPYRINDANDLAALAVSVNSGNDYSGQYLMLGADIDLSGMEWTPIGGMSDADSSGVPTGNYFAGYFNGNNHVITNMDFEIAEDEAGTYGYGLFGCVKGGEIWNLTVKGDIHFETDPTEIHGIGSVAGFIDGSIVNCTAVCDIASNSNASGVGGIAGIATNITNVNYMPNIIRACVNKKTVQGRSRIGGIVGAVYCSDEGDVIIDQCCNTGNIKCLPTSGTCYVGGIAGYCQGDIQYCYNTATISTNGGRYLGGIAGILTGSPAASMTGCYNSGTFDGSTTNAKIQMLYANSDNSDEVEVTDCFWLSGTSFSQSQTTTENTDCSWNNVAAKTAAELADSGMVGSGGLSAVYYTADSPAPVLNWQTGTVYYPGPVYMDGNSATSIGTQDKPFNTVQDAAAAVNTLRNRIIVLDTTDVGSAYTYLGSSDYVTYVRRGNNCTGDMFTVSSSGFELKNTIINGYYPATVSGSIVKITDNTLVIKKGTVLKNNRTVGNGGAIDQQGGSVYIYGGKILDNNADNGGAVALENGQLDIKSVLIKGNTAGTHGDGIYYSSGGNLLITPGSGYFNIVDVIYLTDQSEMTIDPSIAAIDGPINIEAEVPDSHPIIAEGTTGLTSADIANLNCVNSGYSVYLNSDNEAYINDSPAVAADNLQTMNLLEDTVSGEVTENVTWSDGSIISGAVTVSGGTEDNPIVITVDGTISYTNSNIVPITINTGAYVKIIGTTSDAKMIKGWTGASAPNPMIIVKGTLETSDIIFDGGTNDSVTTGYSLFTINAGSKVVLGSGTVIQNDACTYSTIKAGVVDMRGGTIILDGCTIKNCYCIAPGTKTNQKYRANYITVQSTSGDIIVNSCNIEGVESSPNTRAFYSNKSDSSSPIAEINPTGNISIPGSITGATNSLVSITKQEGYPISSAVADETDITADINNAEGAYSLTNGVSNEIAITVQEADPEPAAPAFEASLANVSKDLAAAGETFTADVVLTSDTVPASAALDLNVNSDVAKIVSITPAEGIGTTESTVATDGASGKVSFYGNTASAAEGLRVATVTFEAVADGTADISLTSEGAGVSGDPADYDITVPESATEVIVKTPSIEAVDFGGSYQLVKYTPNAPIEEGKTVKYGDQEMYLADGSWYCVKADDEAPSLASVSVEEGTQTTYTTVAKGDVNENGKINIVDAQIAYDIANSVHAGFEQLTVTGVLKADANNDTKVTAADARAIQVYVHTGAFKEN